MFRILWLLKVTCCEKGFDCITEFCNCCFRVDMGSQFRMESVIYMSSCAATVFIGALVVVGILLMTLLMSLTVMLQSCQSREAGVIESVKSGHHKYDYCKIEE
jgi:hypothetical protein